MPRRGKSSENPSAEAPAKEAPAAEVLAPTETITKSDIWWAVAPGLRSMLTPDTLVTHNNLECISAQVQKNTEIELDNKLVLQQILTAMKKLGTDSRRGSNASASSKLSSGADAGSRDQEDEDEDDDLPGSQEQRMYQEEMQGELWGSTTRERYNAFLLDGGRKPYKTKTDKAKADAVEFHQQLLSDLAKPADEGGFGPDSGEEAGEEHAYLTLVKNLSDKTFLDMYIELGKTHPSQTKKPKAPKTAPKKTVNTQDASQKTIREEVGSEVSSDGDSDDSDGSDIQITISRGGKKNTQLRSKVKRTASQRHSPPDDPAKKRGKTTIAESSKGRRGKKLAPLEDIEDDEETEETVQRGGDDDSDVEE